MHSFSLLIWVWTTEYEWCWQAGFLQNRVIILLFEPMRHIGLYVKDGEGMSSRPCFSSEIQGDSARSQGRSPL